MLFRSLQANLAKLEQHLSVDKGEIASGNNSRLLKRDTALVQETLVLLRKLQKRGRLTAAYVQDIIEHFQLEEKQLYG